MTLISQTRKRSEKLEVPTDAVPARNIAGLERPPEARAASSFAAPVLLALLLSFASTSLQAADLRAVPGITEPILDVTLSASVPGIITARKFKEGEFVKEGETIIELDKRLEELDVERRRLVVEARRVDYEGTAKLFKTTKGTSKEELDKKESDYKLAMVENAMAVEQLRRRVLTAPLSGTLVDLPLQVGESCQPYQHLARMVDTRRCYLIANLEAAAAAPLKLEQKVDLEIDTGAGATSVAGTIVFLSPVADPASGLMKMKVLFENADQKLRPGLAGRLLLK